MEVYSGNGVQHSSCLYSNTGTRLLSSDVLEWIAQRARNKFQRQKEEQHWKQFCAMRMKWSEKQHVDENGDVTRKKKATFTVGNYVASNEEQRKDPVQYRNANLEVHAVEFILKELKMIRDGLKNLQLAQSPPLQTSRLKTLECGTQTHHSLASEKLTTNVKTKEKPCKRSKHLVPALLKTKAPLSPEEADSKARKKKQILQKVLQQKLVGSRDEFHQQRSNTRLRDYEDERQAILAKILARIEQIEAEEEAIEAHWSTTLLNSMPVKEETPPAQDPNARKLKEALKDAMEKRLQEKIDPILHPKKITPNIKEVPRRQPVPFRLSPETLSSIKSYKKSYEEYLRRIDHAPQEGFDPWAVTERMADSLLDDAILSVAQELTEIHDGYIEQLISKELGPSTSSR